MTELLSGVDAPSDAELISRVRGGDVAAYGELFARHVEAARRLGRQLVRGTDIDDLVSDAFAKVLHVLQNGGGPDVAFRAYLLTSVRRLHIDRIRATSKVQPSDDMAQFDNGIPFQDTAVASFENGAAAKAFASLPERWQLVLWHLEVEGQKPADIAPLLGMTPNSVSALAYRAREGLRQAFLTMHLADNAGDDCRWVTEHLGAYVRKGLARRDTTKVSSHLDECRRCTAMYLELTEVNSNLAGIIAPLLLGAAAAGYVSSGSAAGLTGVSTVFGRVRDLVTSNAGGGAAAGAGSAVTSGGLIAAGAIAAGVAAVTSAALVLGGGGAKEVLIEADQPVRVQAPSGAAPERTSPETGSVAPQDASDPLGDDTGDISGTPDPGDTTLTGAGINADADVVQPVGFTPAAPVSGPEPGLAPGSGAPGTDGPATDPSPGTPPTEPGTGTPAPGPGGPGDEPSTGSPPSGDPDTDNPPSGDPGTPPPVEDGDTPPSSPEPDVTPPLISVPPIVVDPPLLPPVVTPPVVVPPPVPLPPVTITPPLVVIPDQPGPVEFGFVGAPVVSEVDGGSAAAGQHYFTVSLTFDGVQNDDRLELLLSPQAGFCLADGCARGTLSDSRTFVISELAEGTTSHTVTFQARMPGGSTVGVVARLNNGQPLPEMVLRSP